jgi:hypothetical protein
MIVGANPPKAEPVLWRGAPIIKPPFEMGVHDLDQPSDLAIMYGLQTAPIQLFTYGIVYKQRRHGRALHDMEDVE